MFPTDSRSPRVLLVDEEVPLTNLLAIAMRLEDWDVAVASSGGQALELCLEFEPDAILLDMMLPDMSGVDVAAALRARHDTTPIIFATGRSSLDDRLAAFAAGGDDYLTKPFGLEDAVDRLRRMFRRAGVLASSLVVGEFVLDTDSLEAWESGSPLLLDALEFDVLRVTLTASDSLTAPQVRAALRDDGIIEDLDDVERALDRVRAKVAAAAE